MGPAWQNGCTMSTAEQNCGMGPDAAQNGSIITISTAAPNGDKSAAR